MWLLIRAQLVAVKITEITSAVVSANDEYDKMLTCIDNCGQFLDQHKHIYVG